MAWIPSITWTGIREKRSIELYFHGVQDDTFQNVKDINISHILKSENAHDVFRSFVSVHHVNNR